MAWRLGSSVCLAVFAAQFALLGLVERTYAAGSAPLFAAVASVAAWLLVASFARARGARAAAALASAVLLTSLACFYRYDHAPLDAQVVDAALHAWPDVRRALRPLAPRLALLTVPIFALEYALLVCAARVPLRRGPIAVALGAALALGPRLAEATPDWRFADALRSFAPSRPSPHASLEGPRVPALASGRAVLPDVVLVITESVRASDYCSAYDAACATSPEVNALLPSRVPLPHLHAIASYTAVSIAALLTGRTQEGPAEGRPPAPTAFELARAVHLGTARPTVAYWSAQARSVLPRADVASSIDSLVTLETLLGREVDDEDAVIDQGIDARLADHVERAIASLPRPFFLVLHLSGTHAPYFVDPSDAPFAPYRHEVTWAGLSELHNAYRDAIRAQDRSLARMLRAVLREVGGEPHVVFFTSDHGEAFGEHGAIHHGQSLYEEQIHVPGWVAFGGGALDADEEARLRGYATRPVSHVDLLPTILDAYGVLDTFALAETRRALAGRSLLGEATPMPAPLPITNCTALFPCPLDNWGLLFEDHALVAQAWDAAWTCTRVDAPGDAADAATCARLREASLSVWPRLPNHRPNVR